MSCVPPLSRCTRSVWRRSARGKRQWATFTLETCELSSKPVLRRRPESLLQCRSGGAGVTVYTVAYLWLMQKPARLWRNRPPQKLRAPFTTCVPPGHAGKRSRDESVAEWQGSGSRFAPQRVLSQMARHAGGVCSRMASLHVSITEWRNMLGGRGQRPLTILALGVHEEGTWSPLQ